MNFMQTVQETKINVTDDRVKIREMVLKSYHDIKAGKGRDASAFFDELEKRYSDDSV